MSDFFSKMAGSIRTFGGKIQDQKMRSSLARLIDEALDEFQAAEMKLGLIRTDRKLSPDGKLAARQELGKTVMAILAGNADRELNFLVGEKAVLKARFEKLESGDDIGRYLRLREIRDGLKNDKSLEGRFQAAVERGYQLEVGEAFAEAPECLRPDFVTPESIAKIKAHRMAATDPESAQLQEDIQRAESLSRELISAAESGLHQLGVIG